ncbi:uncharacterized protein B0H18DRAFT_1129161 [Fomitopsis serialis]|uniref:uncharacterized protein n=1 Tax=Fomitopsis serialis TaxID=139415 RepID=UPI0020088680|nr:uncharacterized protein B0H18DRAFT_1129161 [Neoantrodia serialis]KAH9911048.1 hypothetical protein B0H18DRAFT_1129161 [Neoantrodia serialis]
MPGKHELVCQAPEIVEHLKQNADTWHHWVTDKNGDAPENVDSIEKLLFVRGWVKTSRCAVVAFFNDCRNVKYKSIGDVGPGYSSQLLDDKEEYTPPGCCARVWPPVGNLPQTDGGSPRHLRAMDEDSGNLSNVCMFLHYFKMKKCASVQEAPPEEEEDPDVALRDEVERDSDPAPEPYDPVNFILDYILKNPKVNVAIASDLDLIRLCEGRSDDGYPIPDDIPKFLRETKPPVNVTEDGLGTLFDEATEMHLATEG